MKTLELLTRAIGYVYLGTIPFRNPVGLSRPKHFRERNAMSGSLDLRPIHCRGVALKFRRVTLLGTTAVRYYDRL